MNVFELTRRLVDIESITGNEAPVGEYLFELLGALARAHGGTVEKIEVEPRRFNVLACFGAPAVTLSTHLDTVPPYFASREDDQYIWGRGACDVKGIIAAMTKAAEELLAAGVSRFALLFVVGEERNSAGAYHMARLGRGSAPRQHGRRRPRRRIEPRAGGARPPAGLGRRGRHRSRGS